MHADVLVQTIQAKCDPIDDDSRSKEILLPRVISQSVRKSVKRGHLMWKNILCILEIFCVRCRVLFFNFQFSILNFKFMVHRATIELV